MKMTILLLSIFTCLNIMAWGTDPVFSFHLEIDISGDYSSEIDFEDYEKKGWRVERNQWGDETYTLGRTDMLFPGSSISENIGDVSFVIRKTPRGAFQACLGISVGDYDSSAEGCTYLHQGVNILTADGGDHASGSWGFDGKAVIHWK